VMVSAVLGFMFCIGITGYVFEDVIGPTGDVPPRPIIALAVCWSAFFGMMGIMILDRLCSITKSIETKRCGLAVAICS